MLLFESFYPIPRVPDLYADYEPNSSMETVFVCVYYVLGQYSRRLQVIFVNLRRHLKCDTVSWGSPLPRLRQTQLHQEATMGIHQPTGS